MDEVLLRAIDLKKHFPVTKGIIFAKQIGAIKAVDGINFTIKKGETFGLVGESGCGKTTTAKLILLLEQITGGSILYDGVSIAELSKSELKQYRSCVQAVFQDPYSSLSPRMKVGDIIAEPLVVNAKLSKKAIKERVAEILEIVGLPDYGAQLYPHEFSGGQRQRIAIARAIAPNPALILLDEPVSALDISIRSQIMNLLYDIQQELGITYLLIAHDLAVVGHMSDRMGVMYLGKLVETADSEELSAHPLNPYTQALISASLPLHPDEQRAEIILPGEVGSPFNPPPGCRFHPRCLYAKPVCSVEEPPLKQIANDHEVACHLY